MTASPHHNYERIKVLNEMRLMRKNQIKWHNEGKGRLWIDTFDNLQRELERLNIILFGTPAPGIIN